ncbi:MAG: hypothetical protein ABSG36_02865 [Acidimicrobiales bacterium]
MHAPDRPRSQSCRAARGTAWRLSDALAVLVSSICDADMTCTQMIGGLAVFGVLALLVPAGVSPEPVRRSAYATTT